MEPPAKVARHDGAGGAPPPVGFVGLGAMGSGMAAALLSRGFALRVFDAFPQAQEAVVSKGAVGAADPCGVVAAGVNVLVLMVVSAEQAEAVLWGDRGAIKDQDHGLRAGSVVVLCSTVPPSAAESIGEKLRGSGHLFVDAPVSGGVARAAEGALTIMASGESDALRKADSVLRAMSSKLFHVGDKPGAGSSVKMVNQLLAGVHIAAAAEAMALGARAGLCTRRLFEIISTAAGSSWMFQNRVPHMLDEEYSPPKSQLDIFVKDLGIVLAEARKLVFPCSLAAAAHQQFLLGSAAGFGKWDDAAVVKPIEQLTGVRVAAPAEAAKPPQHEGGGEEGHPSEQKAAVGFVGLGAMGSGMTASLLARGFKVHAFDSHPPALEAAVAKGAVSAANPGALAAAGVDVLVLMVVSATQAEEVLFGEAGAVSSGGLKLGSVVVLCSTVPPSAARSICQRLEQSGHLFVDAPVSGGVVRAAEGALTIMASGKPAALRKASGVLHAMSKSLFEVGEKAGDGSSVKMVNQLLAGVHIAAAAEAVALGARAGLDTRRLFDIISTAAGSSWMFENRVPHMLDGEYSPPKSQLDIFVKDLGIVLGEARELVFPCPLAAAAHQQFLLGSAAGLGRLDDAAVVKVLERMTGVTVAAPRQQAPATG